MDDNLIVAETMLDEYPYTLEGWFRWTPERGLEPGSKEVVRTDQDGKQWVSITFPAAEKRRLFINGAEYPVWRWVPEWVRYLVWRYRVWRLGRRKAWHGWRRP